MSFKLLEIGRFALVAAAICVATAPSPSYAATNVTENVTLTEDTDWTEFGQVTIADGVTIDLNGYALKVAAIDGAGSIVDSFAEYERLEYLEAEQENAGNLYGARNNAQYIDTGYKHNGTTKVEMRLVFTQTSYPTVSGIQSANYAAYYGSRNNGDNTNKQYDFGCWLMNGKIANNGTAGGAGANTTGSPDAVVGRTYDVVLDKSSAAKSSMAWDGGSYEFSIGNGGDGTPKYGSAELTDFIFAINQYDGTYWPNFPCRMQCYSCKIYDKKDADGNTVSDYSLKRDFIPVRRKTDKELGMFDLVEGKFYGNAGGGEFTADATVSEGGLQIASGGAASDFSALTIGSGVALVFSGECALAADLDATAFASVKVASGAVLDLAGHNLTVNAVTGAGTITDTVGTALSGYDRLDFIQSTGTQYIDTGYLHNKNTKVLVRVAFTKVSGYSNGDYCVFYGARSTDRKTQLGGWLHAGKFMEACDDAASDSSLSATEGTIYDVELAKTGSYGVSNLTTDAYTTLGSGNGYASSPYHGSTPLTDYIFAIYQDGSVGWRCLMKCYGCKIWEGGVLMRDFVPAKRGDVLGLLDLAQGVFYTNAGSGKFTAGTVVTTTPGGELRIAVAEGKTVEISETVLTGGLKLVKTGAGTLVMSKASQGYAGGTEVQGGTLKGGAAAARVFGAEGTEIAVGSAGNVDLNGNANLAAYGWTVAAGGTIVNSGADIAASLAVSGVFSPVVTTGDFAATLSDGATLDFTQWMGAFPVASPAISYASGANITLKLEPATTGITALARSKDAETGKRNGYLLSWGAIPSGVTFSPDAATRARFRIVSETNGLRVSFKGGFCIIIK